jgi:hypothetical protein
MVIFCPGADLAPLRFVDLLIAKPAPRASYCAAALAVDPGSECFDGGNGEGGDVSLYTSWLGVESGRARLVGVSLFSGLCWSIWFEVRRIGWPQAKYLLGIPCCA